MRDNAYFVKVLNEKITELMLYIRYLLILWYFGTTYTPKGDKRPLRNCCPWKNLSPNYSCDKTKLNNRRKIRFLICKINLLPVKKKVPVKKTKTKISAWKIWKMGRKVAVKKKNPVKKSKQIAIKNFPGSIFFPKKYLRSHTHPKSGNVLLGIWNAPQV